MLQFGLIYQFRNIREVLVRIGQKAYAIRLLVTQVQAKGFHKTTCIKHPL